MAALVIGAFFTVLVIAFVLAAEVLEGLTVEAPLSEAVKQASHWTRLD